MSFEGLVRQFLDDIAGLSFEGGAEIELEGIALESDQVQIAPSLVLRRPKREDFEEEYLYFGPGPSSGSFVLRSMSAIATLRLKTTGPRETQLAIEKVVAMLRLFQVGSVKYLTYRLWGASITRYLGGRMTAGERQAAYETAFLRSRDEHRLLSFWHTLDPVIPISLYHVAPTGWDYRTIAYERYTAALMNPASFEERIASAAMALEALLLEERQELAYRLRFRAAKLLVFLGESPVAVRDAFRDAYSVRSTVAHGGRLSASHRQVLENRYHQAGGLTHTILNMVRKAILVSLLVARPKKDLIGLIDEALIERTREDELAQLLSPVAELLYREAVTSFQG